MFELAAYLEKANNPNAFKKLETVIQVKRVEDGFFDKSLVNFLAALQQSHSPFLASIMTEENFKLSDDKKTLIATLSKELSFNDEVQSDIEKLLTKLHLTNSSKDINISKSIENEFVIFITSNGTYKNMLVDEDGDIELLIIPSDKTKTYNKRFYKEDGLNFSNVVSTFNEMR